MASQDVDSMDLEQMKKAYLEAVALKEKAEKDKEEAEKKAQEAEEKLRDINFLEFLDATHVHLHMTIQVQTDKTLATQGDPSNATGKFCPKLIQPWLDFPAQQDAIWSQLDKLGGNTKNTPGFKSITYFKNLGEINKRKIGSERDLEFYAHLMVQLQVSDAIGHFGKNSTLRETMSLHDGVEFENHPNTLSHDDLDVVQRMKLMNFVTPKKPSKSSRAAPNDPDSILKHVDQICVYKLAGGQRIACFIVEYKAPHKLTLAHFNAGLRPMDPMLEVVNCTTVPSNNEDHAQVDYYSGRLVAAVVTQTYSYMISAGLRYGYICTGEAFVFLNVRPEEPTTVYFHLSIPERDVGPSTGWLAGSEAPNRLHLTAVGQVFAFTIRAIQKRSLGPEWIANAKAQLKTWEVDAQEVLEAIPTTVREKIRDSAFKPSKRHKDLPMRKSPYFLRSHNPSVKGSSRCALSEAKNNGKFEDDDEDDDHFNHGDSDENDKIDTPTHSSTSHRGSKQPETTCKYRYNSNTGQDLVYCTQRCLLGLLKGGILDKTCPNHGLHRKHGGHHSITSTTFLSLMQQQLSDNLEADCYPLYIQGSRGALFKVRLISHGYTVAAKCTIYAYVSDLLHEGLVYKQLEDIQGIHVPVCLGNMDLERIYSYDCGVEITHMLFMSWGGKRIDYQSPQPDSQLMTKQAMDAIHAIHKCGILHKDVMPRNLLWNEEIQHVMFIDFERSMITTMLPAKHPLMPISPNRKRKLPNPEASGNLKTDGKEQNVEQVLDKPKFRIFADGDGENGVVLEAAVPKAAKKFEAAFSYEVKCLKAELVDLKCLG